MYQTDLSQHVHYFLDVVSTFSLSLSLPLSLFLYLSVSHCVSITLSISFSLSQYIGVSGVGFAASTVKSGPFGRVSSSPSGERKTDYEGNENQAD